MSLSKKTRFEVFKRDGFACQYCGSHPPGSLLEVDHITPRASGGLDEIDNLITACFDCNRGEGARYLSVAPQSIAEKTRIIREKEEQLAAHEAVLAEKRAREDLVIDEIERVFSERFDGYVFKDRFR